jgi:alpha-galactosidase
MGAGSTIFVKNIIGDCMFAESLRDAEIALYDIDGQRLKESLTLLQALNRNANDGRMKIKGFRGKGERKKALAGADYVVNAIQVGGYSPSTVIDFEIPTRYGLRQTIADTLGIGGIFRALRTIPVMFEFAAEMEKVCPNAWLLNYTNPMAMLAGAMLRGTPVRTVGLCHSVQGCAKGLLWQLGMDNSMKDLRWKIAGINHMAWLLEIQAGGVDLYPEIKTRSEAAVKRILKKGAKKVFDAAVAKAKRTGAEHWWHLPGDSRLSHDLVRHELMRNFGYYVTESSEHNAEYTPYWIKSAQPGLIEKYNIPLDEYPRRCLSQIKGWEKQSKALLADGKISHSRSHEYGSFIMDAIETDTPYRIHGNVLNGGAIGNLPANACVEVPCMVDRNGVNPCQVGDLPEQCAALNRTNINVHNLVIEAALTRRRDTVYQAAFLDPHTAAELSLDQIRSLCDDLIKAHGAYLPSYV